MMTEVKARNPRNPAHIMAAIAIIQLHGESRVASETTMLLDRLGIDIPGATMLGKNRVLRSDRPRNGERLVSSHFLLEQGLSFSDNIITTCDKCRVAIQIRPQDLVLKEKYCVFCSADMVLVEAGSQTARSSSRRERR